MNKKIILFILIFFLFLPIKTSALSLSCRSCIIMDNDSGRVLYEKDIHSPRLIASTTKIMTAILAIESNKLNDVVTIGEEVLKMYGSNIYIEPGEKMRLEDLVYGLMLRSGNDAAIAIATYLSGSEQEFVKEMNRKAKEIGMNNTIFNNSHGLDDETRNTSTAYDMALLSQYISKNKIYMKIASTKKHSVKTNKKTYTWNNRNNLLYSYSKLTSGKTGYTPDAGKTLVTTASNNNLNLTAVALNDGNHYESHRTMYEYVFNNYKKYLILDKNRFKIDKKYFKDKIYIKNNFSYPLMEEEKENIKVLVKLEKINDYKNADEIGEVEVYLSDKIIYKDKIYVEKTQEKSIFTKIKEWLFN